MNKRISVFAFLSLVFPLAFFLTSCGSGFGLVTITPPPSATPEILATPELVTPTAPPSPIASPTCIWPCPSDSMTLTAVMAPTLTAMNNATPTCVWPCPSDSLTLTAEMAVTLTAIPSNTPPPWATVVPVVGDLGWGSVYGKIVDGNTNIPINGATVKCEQFSYTSPYPCNGITTTNKDGVYAFTGVYFHDTDQITLIVEAPGYDTLRFKQSFFTSPDFHADLGLFPTTTAVAPLTLTPYVMCTPPACTNGVLACGNPNGCPGGCGTVCIASTPTP